ncbi:MAG: hypothetical protein E7517_00095 [Ruminococcaceae bacterium]|nr:hypothetical protein [Oscillospiraceae bacterium]
MNKQIINNPQVTKSGAKNISQLCETPIAKADCKSKNSIGGGVAKYSDKIAATLDSDINKAFKHTFMNSALKLNKIADDFIVSDKNVSLEE